MSLEMTTVAVLAHHTHPLGACYLARQGQLFLAGRTPETARTYPNAQAIIDAYRDQAEAGTHWAWNLCYLAEDHLSPAPV
jgi:hypothetical protein